MAMTLLLVEGWEFAPTFNAANYGHNWGSFAGGGGVSASSPRTGNGCLDMNQEQTVNLGTNQDINVACAFRITSDVTTKLLRLRDAVDGNIHLTFERRTSTRSIRVTGPGGTLGETASDVFLNGVWVHMEVKVNIADSTGSVKLRLNGAEVLSLSNVDTQNGSNAYVSVIELVRDQGVFADDLVIGTGGASDYFGDVKVVQVLPTGAGNHTQFTPSAGSNFQNVDDATTTIDSDSTYNASSTNGHKDSYDCTALGVTGTVIGVAALAHLRKDDAGSRDARIFTRVNGTDYPGSDVSLGNSFQTYQQLMQNNPDTAAAWTVSEVDGAEPGVEVRS